MNRYAPEFPENSLKIDVNEGVLYDNIVQVCVCMYVRVRVFARQTEADEQPILNWGRIIS